jgi:transcriptional regulator with XRE-family HTH domain/quercetin dioxygenase-like cupin family protein
MAVPPVGDRIRRARLARQVSLRALAREIGVSASLISQIETGKSRPSVGTLYAITTALGISVEEIFDAPVIASPDPPPAGGPADPDLADVADPADLADPAGPVLEPAATTAPGATAAAGTAGTAAPGAATAATPGSATPGSATPRSATPGSTTPEAATSAAASPGATPGRSATPVTSGPDAAPDPPPDAATSAVPGGDATDGSGAEPLAPGTLGRETLAPAVLDPAGPDPATVVPGLAGIPMQAGTVPEAIGALAALAADPVRRVGPVVRAAQRDVLHLDSGVVWERLGRIPGTTVDFLLVTYAPGGSSSSTDRLMRHPGAEYGYLIEGELILTLGFDEHRLRPGDAVCFESTTPHRYRNDGEQPAVGVWFVSEHEDGTREGGQLR